MIPLQLGKIRDFLLCWLVLLMSYQVEAQINYQFNQLTSEEGLLDDLALRIFQDSEGYLWIGTDAGLQRFDGYNFLNFTYSIEDQEGLPQSIVRHISELKDGSIWIGTQGGGIARYKDGQMLTPIQHQPDQNSLSSNFVEDVLEASNGDIWVATSLGLNRIRNNHFDVFQYDQNDFSSLSDNSVFCLYEDVDGQIWVGTKNGLNKFNGEDGFERIYLSELDGGAYASNFVHDIVQDRERNFWIAIVEGGLVKWNFNTNEFIRYVDEPGSPTSLGGNIPLRLVVDYDGAIWVAKYGGGLNKIKDGMVERFQHDALNSTSISSDIVEDVMLDKFGNIWTANLGGVNRYSRTLVNSYPYSVYRADGMLPTTGLKQIIKTRDGKLWVGTHNGIILYDQQKFKSLLSESKGETGIQLSGRRAETLFEDSKGRVWVGYEGDGLDVIDGYQIQHFPYKEGDTGTIHSGSIRCISEDGQGNIWIGTEASGVAVYDGHVFRIYQNDPNDPGSISSNRIWDFHPASDGSMWIATEGGGLVNHRDGQFQSYDKQNADSGRGLPTEVILTVHSISKSKVWIGFSGGAALFNPEENSYKLFTEEQGVAGTIVEDIAEDADGNIWVATHKGASRFNPSLNKFESFDKSDGFTDHKLVTVFSDEEKRKLYFGGPEGFYTIQIDEFNKAYEKIPELRFTEFEITSNLPANVATKKPLSGVDPSMKLTYDENSFKVSFAALSGELNPHYDYSYRLLPVNEKWTYLGNENSVSFTFLEAADYELQLRTSIGNQTLERSLYVSIATPWWQAWWFRMGVVLIGVSLIYGVIRWRTYTLYKRKKILEGIIRKRTSELEEINEALQKTNFDLKEKGDQLTMALNELQSAQQKLVQAEKMASLGLLAAGVGHEINNPLNFIKGGITSLLKHIRKDPSDQKGVNTFADIVYEGVDRVSKIVKSLGYFSRDGESMIEDCDLHEILENCVTMLQNKFKTKVTLEKNYAKEQLMIRGNIGKLHQAFLNILSNAEQAILETGKILIETSQDEDGILVCVEDNGVGIPYENLKKIRDPFFTTKLPGEGTGLGLAITYEIIENHGGGIVIDSQVNVHTRFEIRFPAEVMLVNE